MNLRINSRHLEVTPGIRDHLENRLERIRKHFDHVIDASAFLMVDKAKEKGLRQTAEDLYHAMDAVIDKLDRQVIKHKERIQDHHHDKHLQ